MKKLISILCAGAMLLSLAACGSTSGGASAADTNITADSVVSSDKAGSTNTGSTVTDADIAAQLADAVTLTFSDNGITADGSGGFETDGTALTITDAGAYVLTGSCADGSVKVKKGVTGVTLVLSGLELTSADTAPITCAKSSQVVLYAAAGTENRLADTAQNNDETYSENADAENAVIKCKDGSQVTLCGSGSLVIEANGKNGIKSGATTAEEGEASLTIRDITLTIAAPVNDAINAEQLLVIESGTLTIAAGDDAIHCDLLLNIGAEGTDGPAITITDCYEAIEAATLNILSGDIDITSSDDCLNAANSDLSGYAFSMNISGGTITAFSSGGDGFDSNGSLTISGGTVVVWTANTADNQPLDADGTITISGGTVLAAGGSSSMGMNLSASQTCVTFGASGMGGFGSSAITKGSAISIQDASGTTVYSGTALCNAGFVFFSSPALTDGTTYTLTGGSSTLTADAQTGSISSGMGGMGGPGGQMPDGQFPGGNGQRPSMPGNEQSPAAPGSGS